MAGMLRVPRSRGALSGVLLLLLGVWGGLVPFVGPYFHYAYTPDRGWAYTSGRLWLEILPGVATALGGLIVLGSANRAVAAFGAWLAALGGAWFVVGRTFSRWPATHLPEVGVATGSALMRTVEEIGFFSGLGVVIVFISAFALGRFAVLGPREAAPATTEPSADEAAGANDLGRTDPAKDRAEVPATGAGTDTGSGARTRTIFGRRVAPAKDSSDAGPATKVSSDT
jgi:hypothetical protein